MRSLLLSYALAVAACSTGGTPLLDLGVPAPGDMSVPVSGCTATCTPGCAPGFTCVVMAGNVNFFNATCLAPCTSKDDCPDQRACVEILGGTTPGGRFCLNRAEPVTCGAHCQLDGNVSFCSGSEQVGGYQNSVVCGHSYHHCTNGCVEDAPDGGSDRQARCL